MNEAQERSLKAYRRDVLNECETCEGTNGQHSVSCLAEADRHYIYTCGVCGKNSTLPKGSDDRRFGPFFYSSPSLHFSGCARIGKATHW